MYERNTLEIRIWLIAVLISSLNCLCPLWLVGVYITFGLMTLLKSQLKITPLRLTISYNSFTKHGAPGISLKSWKWDLHCQGCMTDVAQPVHTYCMLLLCVKPVWQASERGGEVKQGSEEKKGACKAHKDRGGGSLQGCYCFLHSVS